MRYTHESFVRKVKEVSPEIEVLGEFISTNLPIRVKCEHGHEWEPRGKSLTAGHGCPYCSGRFLLTQEEFVKRMNDVNPGFKVIGEYKGQFEIVEMECGEGHRWKAEAHGLLIGKGCPHCKTELMREVMKNTISKWSE